MATLIEIAGIRTDAVLAQRVESAIAKVAQYIIEAEAGNTPNARNRRDWAYDAILQPEAYLKRMMNCVAGNATVQAAYISTSPPDQANVPDADIEYCVNVMVDVFASRRP